MLSIIAVLTIHEEQDLGSGPEPPEHIYLRQIWWVSRSTGGREKIQSVGSGAVQEQEKKTVILVAAPPTENPETSISTASLAALGSENPLGSFLLKVQLSRCGCSGCDPTFLLFQSPCQYASLK